jgi:DNA-binding MarR family transcriptional regulator
MSESPPEICNCSALRQAARHVSRYYDGALAPFGLGLNQYAVLARLARLGPRTVQELADNLVMDRSTLGHLLRPLERRGLLRLETSGQDRRQRRIVLTAAGDALQRDARRAWERMQRHFETAFGVAAARDLRTLLKRAESTNLSGPVTDGVAPRAG